MNDPTQIMMNRNFGSWQQHDDPFIFQNPRPIFPLIAVPNPSRINWKIMKTADKRKKPAASSLSAATTGGVNNKLKRFYPKKKFTRFAPLAPRNTTSFIIRAKKSGGITSLVSPCPVTPAILPTPKFSPSREGLVDMAKEEWGVDGYGSMKGLIRIRSVGGDDGSSESDDLSRFEMVNPSFDSQIARLEEENKCLKGRLFLMEREMGDLRRRLQNLERINNNNNNNNCINNDNECSYSNDNNNNMNVNEDKIVGDESNGTQMREGD